MNFINNSPEFDRTIKLIGEKNFNFIKEKSVLIVGLGGVGGYVFEHLVRSGIQKFTIVDCDVVDISNLNRQIIALKNCIGLPKVEVAKTRALQINSNVNVRTLYQKYCAQSHAEVFSQSYDYCIDCFDSVKEKIEFIVHCSKNNLKIISAMGAGNRINPNFRVCDIKNTAYDPLARAIRKKLKEINITSLKVVCDVNPVTMTSKTPTSISYSPAIMGSLIAQQVIIDLLNSQGE